jgi:hypothetical protein
MVKRRERELKTWTREEDEALKELWGDSTPDSIGRQLGRTTVAIIQRRKILGLPPYIEGGEFITVNQATQLLGVDSHVPDRTWIPKYNFPVKYRRTAGRVRFKVVKVEDLMKWLKDNPDAWDSRKVEPYALGTEPAWLKEKRAADAAKEHKPRNKKYTPQEDAAIVYGLHKNLTYRQIGAQIGRSADSVQARSYRLDVWGTGKLKPKGTRGSGTALY